MEIVGSSNVNILLVNIINQITAIPALFKQNYLPFEQIILRSSLSVLAKLVSQPYAPCPIIKQRSRRIKTSRRENPAIRTYVITMFLHSRFACVARRDTATIRACRPLLGMDLRENKEIV